MKPSRDDVLVGTIVESLPNVEYRVHIHGTPDDESIRCYVAGKMKLNRVHVLLGDEVECVYPRGSAVGRIVFRRIKRT